MRVAIVTASVVAAALGAWAAEAAAPIPPKCSASDTRSYATLRTEGMKTGGPGYVRYCGPGRAVLRVRGQSFTIKGGSCYSRTVGFGLNGYGGLRGKGFWARLQPPWYMRPGRIPIIDGVVQLPGFASLPRTGMAIVAKDLKSATFSLGSPSQTNITGSWTCG